MKNTKSRSLPELDREKRSAQVKNKTLTWDDPDWHVLVDKDDEVYIYYLKDPDFLEDPDLWRSQFQVFRGIWSRSRSLGEYLVPVDITGYLIPEGYQYSGAPVGSFLRTGLTITSIPKLPLLSSVMMYEGDIVCIEDLILGGDKPRAVISHNQAAIPYAETVDVDLLEQQDELGYNPCMSFEDLTEPLTKIFYLEEPPVKQMAYQTIEKTLTPQANICDCPMQSLLRSGCQCGGS